MKTTSKINTKSDTDYSLRWSHRSQCAVGTSRWRTTNPNSPCQGEQSRKAHMHTIAHLRRWLRGKDIQQGAIDECMAKLAEKEARTPQSLAEAVVKTVTSHGNRDIPSFVKAYEIANNVIRNHSIMTAEALYAARREMNLAILDGLQAFRHSRWFNFETEEAYQELTYIFN